MKTLKSLIIACIITFTSMSYGQDNKLSNSILWKIESPDLGKSSYLLGTLHMMCEEDFSIPEKVKAALKNSEQLVLEINLSDPLEMQALQKEVINSPKISETLNEDQFATLDSISQGVMGAPLKTFDAYGLTSFYSIIIMKMLPCSQVKSMESELTQMALENKLSIAGFETATSQYSAIGKAYPPIENYRLILLHEEYNKDFNEAIKLYKNEDIEEASNLLMKEEYMDSNAKEHLLKIRNQQWLNKVPGMMASKSNLFAVGAAHLVGPYGLIQLLKEKGYRVTPVL